MKLVRLYLKVINVNKCCQKNTDIRKIKIRLCSVIFSFRNNNIVFFNIKFKCYIIQTIIIIIIIYI